MNYTSHLETSFSFIYKVDLDNGLTEHELDHVLIGRSNSNPILNPEEASDYKWISIDAVIKDISENEGDYTFWFKLILKDYRNKLEKSLNILHESL